MILGIALTFIGFILMALHPTRRGEKARVGGAVLIGPFPIIFGDREMVKYAFILLIICIALTLILILR